MTENFLKEAEKTFKELEFYREKSSELEKQNSLLKNLIESRNKKISEYDSKLRNLLAAAAKREKEIGKLKNNEDAEKIILHEKNKIIELANQISHLKSQIDLINAGKNSDAEKIIQLKRMVVGKNKLLLNQEKKIDELTRFIVNADRIITGLKDELISKEEKIKKLSEKVLEFTDLQKKELINFRIKIERDDKEIKKLKEEKNEAQSKLGGLFGKYSKIRSEAQQLAGIVGEQNKKISLYCENKKNIEEDYKKIREKEGHIEKLAIAAKQGEEKIKSLENINRQIVLRYEEEKAILSSIIRAKDEELKKIIRFAERKAPHTSLKEKPAVKMLVSRPSGPVEQREIEAMVKIALAHGDSPENIKKSLINSGYEKDKIEVVIRRS